MEYAQCAGPPPGRLRCLRCRAVSDGPAAVSCHYSPHPQRGYSLVVITIQCPRCKAVCLRVTYPGLTENAATTSLIVRSNTAQLEYWPRALCGAVGHMQPSVRPGEPSPPLTFEDMQRFKAELDKTSFRRTTQSWQRFLDRLLREPPDPEPRS
jgi:hypothetical protein